MYQRIIWLEEIFKIIESRTHAALSERESRKHAAGTGLLEMGAVQKSAQLEVG